MQIEPIEIRANRKFLTVFIIILVVAFLGMNYTAFFTGDYKNYVTIMQFVTIGLSIMLARAIYKLYKIIKGNPVGISMTADKFSYLELEKDRYASYYWNDIVNWELEKDDSKNFLVIHVFGRKEKIGIDMLDKSPKEIVELMEKFKAHNSRT